MKQSVSAPPEGQFEHEALQLPFHGGRAGIVDQSIDRPRRFDRPS
ncbi:hypothetical protein [Mesorhizobium sp. M0976]